MKVFKLILTIALVNIASSCFSKQADEEAIPTLLLDETKLEPSLSSNESKYVFVFRNFWDDAISRTISYSIDGVSSTAILIDKTKFEIVTKPGNHIFQFYYSSDYLEVYTDSLEILPQYQNDYSIYLNYSEIEILSEKPIIYLYPVSDTAVTVKLKVSGELTFTYPEYKNGWEFIARPNGDLTFGDDTYNYLFWESTQKYSMNYDEFAVGFHVKGEDATSFLQKTLIEAGLTSKERTDFITYWAPRLAQNEMNFIRFEFNESCNRFAELEITPKPDELYRIYMLWFPTTSITKTTPQEIKTVIREGFTVIEWGGQELQSSLNHSLTN